MMNRDHPASRNQLVWPWICLLIAWVSQVCANSQVLPPPKLPETLSKPIAEAGLFIRAFKFEGNTAFSADELARVTRSFSGRTIHTDELEEARRAVTMHYVSHGYINSGAIIPDQDPTNGVVLIHIVEGTLTGVDLKGNNWLADKYILHRLERWSGPPLNATELQEGLQLLRQNPNVRQVNAEMKPGTAPGEAVLDLKVTDAHPFRVGIQFDNQRPPSVGGEEISILAADLNLTGLSDVLDLRYGIAQAGGDGLEFSEFDNVEASYTLPFTRYDTSVGLYASRLNTSLVEETFSPLDISSVTTTYGIVLRQPFFQTANREAAVSFAFDHRRNDSWLLGEPFNLTPGAVDGEIRVSVLRFAQEWTQRGQNHVLALRSTINGGIQVLDATDNGVSGDPDGKFFSWLGQGQYIRRLFNTQNQFLFRLTGQWANEPLLALEQISVGGLETVRGYRENQLVRDRAIIASLEFRLPILFNKAGAGIIQLAPFFDFGGGWNSRNTPHPDTIYSAGIGLLLNPNKHISAQLYWGHAFRDIDMPDDNDLQDLGLHFRVNIHAF